MNINDAKQVLIRTHKAAIRNHQRASGMHLESTPGTGKSQATLQYVTDLAREIGEPVGLVQFMLATISSVDVRGFMIPTKSETVGVMNTVFSTPPWFPVKGNTTVVTPDGTVHRAGTWVGDPPHVGVLFLDEFSQAEDEVKKPAAELVLNGEVGNVRLPDNWRVVSAGNRMSDRSGVLRELMFIVNRRCKLAIEPHMATWLEYVNALPPLERPHYLTLSFARKNPDIVFADKVPEGSEPFCTPRSLCALDKDLRALRSDEDERLDRLPLDGIAREVAIGRIGAGSAAQFYTHLKYADELPEVSEIEKDPTKAKLPANKDAQMVCGYMLAHHVNEKNAGKIVTYMQRLNIEMQVLAGHAILAQQDRASHVLSSPDFAIWLKKNRELLVASKS